MLPKSVLNIVLIVIVLIMGTASSSAKDLYVFRIADSNSHFLPENEREHLRARDLRERSEQKSNAHLGYSDIFQESPDRTIDYYLLSHQITRLKALIEALESQEPKTLSANSKFIPRLPPRLALAPSLGTSSGSQTGGEMSSIYGVEGPNAKSVRLLLEYNLMVASNPRLRIGKIKENKESILAEIVTQDGSLVEKFSIDRKTGLWKVIR